eukprot:7564034-Heterocapsa_arctica.AAC.1
MIVRQVGHGSDDLDTFAATATTCGRGRCWLFSQRRIVKVAADGWHRSGRENRISSRAPAIEPE